MVFVLKSYLPLSTKTIVHLHTQTQIMVGGGESNAVPRSEIAQINESNGQLGTRT
ncbi:hypothetical protein O9929_24625 [Vibrio lentus]|nr:hypothetical protein [Vibrio lentus]